jgi:acetyltransferase-like isoleucine patch superfamily enzyme
MRIVKSLIYGLIPLFSGAFFLKTIARLKYVGNLIYSGFIYGQLRKSGKHPYFTYPISILGGQYMQIGDNFFTQPGLRIEALDVYKGEKFVPQLCIGDSVIINDNCHIACIGEVTIGNNVLIASRVFITDHFHGRSGDADFNIPPIEKKLYYKGPVVIKENVWLGEGVIVMPGVTIGKGSIIGANSVVTRDVPEYCAFAGVPARMIKRLDTPQKF